MMKMFQGTKYRINKKGRGAIIISKLFESGNVKDERNNCRSANGLPIIGCWAIAEYVIDCHKLWSAIVIKRKLKSR